MKKEFFKPGDLYFICENCGEMCDARGPKLCDCCGEQYTGHEILVYSEAADKRQENEPKSRSHMAPPMPIRPIKQQQEESGQNSMSWSDELPLPRPARLEQPIFSYSVCIYREGQLVDAREDGKPIAFRDNVVKMGRESFLSDSRLFENGLSMDGRFVGISRKNAVFIQEEEKLFVQYCGDDGVKKSRIYINGDRLEQGKCREIGEGDEILFGSLKDPEKRIVVRIHKWSKQPQSDNDLSEKIYQGINRKIDQLAENFSSLQTQMAGMEEQINLFTAKLDPEILKWKEGDTQESYVSRLDDMLGDVHLSGGEEEKQRLIKQFFLWNNEDHFPKYRFMCEDKQLAHYLYGAAVYEKVCSRFDGTEHEDYYAACGSLGKAVEGFVRKEMAALIEQNLQPEFEKFLLRDGKKKKFVEQGAYLTFLKGQNDNETERIKSLFRKLGIVSEKEQNRQLAAWTKAIQDFFRILKKRNENAHPGSVCRKEEYLELKELLLHSTAIPTIHKYYSLMGEKNG